MNILAFDTCFGAVSAAVRWQSSINGFEVRSAYEEMDIGHAEHLLPMIQGLLGEAGLDFASLDALAISIGPGSFTGLRVGVAAARALALATGLPVHGATSLAVMAHRARLELGDRFVERPLVVAVDARYESIYVQKFDSSGVIAQNAPALLKLEQAAELSLGQKAIAVGSGAEHLARAAGSQIDTALPKLQPDARSLIALAPQLRRLTPVFPLYLREPDAKPQSNKVLPRAAQ